MGGEVAQQNAARTGRLRPPRPASPNSRVWGVARQISCFLHLDYLPCRRCGCLYLGTASRPESVLQARKKRLERCLDRQAVRAVLWTSSHWRLARGFLAFLLGIPRRQPYFST